MPAIRYGQHVPESVLMSYGLHRKVTVSDLVKEATKFDTKNKGYLSRDEFEQAAERLSRVHNGSSNSTTTSGFRYARGVAKEVDQAYLRGTPGKRYTEAQLVAAAAAHDNGDKYLSRAELEAGAVDLQLGLDAQTLSKTLGKKWDDGAFPTKLSREPSVSGLRSFEVATIQSNTGDVSVERAQAYVDLRRERVLVKVTTREQLPWAGASAASTAWYSLSLQSLR